MSTFWFVWPVVIDPDRMLCAPYKTTIGAAWSVTSDGVMFGPVTVIVPLKAADLLFGSLTEYVPCTRNVHVVDWDGWRTRLPTHVNPLDGFSTT